MRAHKSVGDVPHGTIESGFPINWIKAAGHLAVWAVMYAIGVALLLGELLGFPLRWEALLYVALCSHAGYLFDRIKFRDVDLDPADLLADPDRHIYLRSIAGRLRVLMIVEWITGMMIGWAITPALGVLVLGGVLAGYLYSGWTPGVRPRFKDIRFIKAWLVSGVVVGLVILTIMGQHGMLAEGFGLGTIRSFFGGYILLDVAGVLLIVSGDAVICDLDDSKSDAKYNTLSLPVVMGDRNAGVTAIFLLLIGGLFILGSGTLSGSVSLRMMLSLLITLSGVGILLGGEMIGGRRDWIDARALLVAALVISV